MLSQRTVLSCAFCLPGASAVTEETRLDELIAVTALTATLFARSAER